MKGKFYKTYVRPTERHGSKCCALNKKKKTKTEVTEINMQKWMFVVTRLTKIKNKHTSV